MTEWTVCGTGTDVLATSPERDVHPFGTTSLTHLDLELTTSPTWHGGPVPEDAGHRADAALGDEARWTHDTFGDPGT